MSAWGECAWTARDLIEVWLVIDDRGVYGECATEGEAIALRESLGAQGYECWVVKAERDREDA